jgi:HK97 family phage major capsid protein
MNRCEWCGGSIDGRADAKFCCAAHRTAAYRAREWQGNESSLEEYRARRASGLPVDSDEDPFWAALLCSDDLAREAAEERALSKASGGAGGYAVPADFRAAIVEAARATSALATVAREVTTDAGGDMPWPATTAHGAAAWTAEAATASATDTTFVAPTMKAYKSDTTMIVSEELDQDTGIPFDAFLASELGGRLGVLQSTAFISGDGSGKPTGLTDGSSVTRVNATTGHTTSFDAAAVKALYRALPKAYRPSATWLIEPDDFAELAFLATTAGDLIFPSLQQSPPTLLGRPVLIEPFFATPAAGTVGAAFGDFGKGYGIRRVRAIGLRQLTERYSDTGQIGLYVKERVDGAVILPDAMRLLAHSAS